MRLFWGQEVQDHSYNVLQSSDAKCDITTEPDPRSHGVYGVTLLWVRSSHGAGPQFLVGFSIEHEMVACVVENASKKPVVVARRQQIIIANWNWVIECYMPRTCIVKVRGNKVTRSSCHWQFCIIFGIISQEWKVAASSHLVLCSFPKTLINT